MSVSLPSGVPDEQQEDYREVTEAEPLGEPRLDHFLAYWLSARGTRALPERSAIDPLKLPTDILPFINVFDVEPGPRFKLRLSGTRIAELFGRNYAGSYLEDIPGAESTRQRMLRQMGSGRPYYCRTRLTWENKDHVTYRALCCPFSEPGGEAISRLVAVTVYD